VHLKKHINLKKKDNIIFGLIFFIFFTIITLYSLKSEGILKIWSVIFSLFFLIITILAPDKLSSLNKLWIRFGYLLGNIISPIVMGLVFFFVVTPIGVFIRLLKKDIMGLKKNKSSYWIDREDRAQTMRKQF
jgi:hypothetical protein